MLSFNTKIEELPFRPRERRALVHLGVETVKDLLSRNLQPILLVRGYSEKTYAALKKARDTIRRMLAEAAGGENQRDAFLQTDVEELELDRRVRTALQRLGIFKVGELLELEVDGAIAPPGCGPVTVQRLRESQEKLRMRLESLDGISGGELAVAEPVDLSLELSWLQNRDQIETPPAVPAAENPAPPCPAVNGGELPHGE